MDTLQFTEYDLHLIAFKERCAYFDAVCTKHLKYQDSFWYVYAVNNKAFMTLEPSKVPKQLQVQKVWRTKGPLKAQQLRNFLNSLPVATFNYCAKDATSLAKLFKEHTKRQTRTKLAIALEK